MGKILFRSLIDNSGDTNFLLATRWQPQSLNTSACEWGCDVLVPDVINNSSSASKNHAFFENGSLVICNPNKQKWPLYLFSVHEIWRYLILYAHKMPQCSSISLRWVCVKFTIQSCFVVLRGTCFNKKERVKGKSESFHKLMIL